MLSYSSSWLLYPEDEGTTILWSIRTQWHSRVTSQNTHLQQYHCENLKSRKNTLILKFPIPHYFSVFWDESSFKFEHHIIDSKIAIKCNKNLQYNKNSSLCNFHSLQIKIVFAQGKGLNTALNLKINYRLEPQHEVYTSLLHVGLHSISFSVFTHLLLGVPCCIVGETANYSPPPTAPPLPHSQSNFVSKVIQLSYQLVVNYDITLQSHHINKF